MERPILFSAPMVRAILAGAKTQTRRVVQPQPPNGCSYAINGAQSAAVCAAVLPSGEPVFVPPTPRSQDHLLPCPHGAPGDTLWVRETWYDDAPGANDPKKVEYRATHECRNWEAGCPFDGDGGGRWRPSIHMPRWASRLTLRVTSVRVERLHAITPAGIVAEGVRVPVSLDGAVLVEVSGDNSPLEFLDPRAETRTMEDHLRAQWASLWSRINGRESWDANPWVWVVGFERVTT